jgi:hemolysin activation/secretion protein
MTSQRGHLGATFVLSALLMPVALFAQDVPSSSAAQPAPARYAIDYFDISGVTKLDAITVEAAVYPFLGPGKANEDVEEARKALEAAYRQRGMETVVVDIPPQEAALFARGVVALRVIEAPVGRVRVTGAKYHLPVMVKNAIPALKEGEVPDLRAVQAQINDANRFPDREITPSLKQGKVPGTIDVDLRMKSKLPLHASLEINDDHSASTTQLRLNAGVRYTNLWQLGHSIAFNYLVSPEDRAESEVISGSYLAPLWDTRWTLLAFGYRSNSNIAAAGGTRVLGDGYSFGVRAIYRLPERGSLFQSVSFGLDYKDFNENLVLASNPNTPFRTPIAYLPLVTSYTMGTGTDNMTLNMTASLTAGIRGIGSGSPNIRDKRFDAIGSFVHVNLDGDFAYILPRDFVVFTRWSGQLSDSPLVANEQIAGGGATSVRGYFQSEAVGDEGLVGGLEIRSPSLAQYLGKRVDELRLYGFLDGAYLTIRSPLAEQNDEFALMSAGLGARFQMFKYVSGSVSIGFPLRAGNDSKKGDQQFNFSVKAEF